MERALVIIKPDGVQRCLVGEIFNRIEKEKLRIIKIKTIRLTKKQVNALYQDSLKKFPQIKNAIISYMTSGDSIIFIVEGKNAIRKVRAIRGSSDPSKSPLGSVRKDFAGDQKMKELTRKGQVTKNIMHSSGSKKEGLFETKLFFGK